MAVPVQQQGQQTLTVLAEEKTFKGRLEECEPLIKSAIEVASGIQLEELTAGMWFGSRKVLTWTTMEVTARVLPTETGTSVELRVEHKTSPIATTLFVLVAICGALLILPLIALIAYGQKSAQEQQRQRLVMMHKMWREISEAIGAPKRASYREAPHRAYAPAERRIEDDAAEEPDEQDDDEEIERTA